MQWITVGGRQYLKYWHSDDPITPKQEATPMTPEERAKSVLHFLDAYLDARVNAHNRGLQIDKNNMEITRQFLGTALVALVTDARKVDE